MTFSPPNSGKPKTPEEAIQKAFEEFFANNPPIFTGKAQRFGTPGQVIPVTLPNGKTKALKCASVVNSREVTGAIDYKSNQGWVWCGSAPRATRTDTVEFYRSNPVAGATDKKKGNIKYLYSLFQDGVRKYYVGGWKPSSVEIVELRGKTIANDSASSGGTRIGVDNLGGDRWSADWVLIDNSNIGYTLTSDNNFYTAPFSGSGSFAFPGFGWWQGLFQSVEGVRVNQYIDKGVITSTPNDYTFVADLDSSFEQTTYQRKLLPNGLTASGIVYSASGVGTVGSAIYTVSLANSYSTFRINKTGTAGIGYFENWSVAGQTQAGALISLARALYLRPGGVQRPTFYSGSLISIAPSLNFESFSNNYWLDVGTDKFFGILKDNFSTVPEFDTDIAVAVFNKSFVQIDERQISIYKADQMPTVEGGPRTLHWVSYSED